MNKKYYPLCVAAMSWKQVKELVPNETKLLEELLNNKDMELDTFMYFVRNEVDIDDEEELFEYNIDKETAQTLLDMWEKLKTRFKEATTIENECLQIMDKYQVDDDLIYLRGHQDIQMYVLVEGDVKRTAPGIKFDVQQAYWTGNY